MKRIVALFSAVLLVLCAVPAMARAEETTTLTVTADKTVANPLCWERLIIWEE